MGLKLYLNHDLLIVTTNSDPLKVYLQTRIETLDNWDFWDSDSSFSSHLASLAIVCSDALTRVPLPPALATQDTLTSSQTRPEGAHVRLKQRKIICKRAS